MTPKSTIKVIDTDTIVVGTEVPNTNRLKFGTSALPYIFCISEIISIQTFKKPDLPKKKVFFPRAQIATILVLRFVNDDVYKPSFEHRICQFKELVLFYLLSIF